VFLGLLQCIAAYLQRALAWVSGETSYLGLLVLIFVPTWSHVAETDQVHVENPVQRTQAVPHHLQKANFSSSSFQRWHPCQLGCDCLSNSYRNVMRSGAIEGYEAEAQAILDGWSRSQNVIDGGAGLWNILVPIPHHKHSLWGMRVVPLLQWYLVFNNSCSVAGAKTSRCWSRSQKKLDAWSWSLKFKFWLHSPGANTHAWRSPTPTVNGFDFNAADTDTNFWAGIQRLDGHNE